MPPTSLRRDTLTLPVADLGPVNPLPPLVRTSDPHEGKTADVDQAMQERIDYGHLATMLPYLTQDGYGRDRTEQEVAAAVLENDVLRATFLLDYGGRLWSLVHVPSGRELLHRNSILQPANLALRNAWFAGGVEWNLGTTGHTPLTCEPLHAVRVTDHDGSPVLRLYEYERSRGLVYSLDFSLPPGSPVLLASVRVTNPTSRTVPLYWWSNIAVPESDDLRVIAPAERAYYFSYDGRLQIVPVPEQDGRDISYPATSPRAADWFFDCEGVDRPWVAAVDGDGRGLVHTSTQRLIGRKLFVWGRSSGGRNWQEFLSGPGERYVEIQGGLSRTQMEHEPLASGETCEWVEAYGLADVDRDAAHGTWQNASAALEEAVAQLTPPGSLEDALSQARGRADAEPVETLHHGSGWGALEHRRREAAGEPPLSSAGTPFESATLGSDQEPWLELLQTGTLSESDPQDPPNSYVVGEGWRHLIEDSGDTWAAWLHRGVARWHAGERRDAYVAMERSLDLKPTAWAWRNLGVMDAAAGDLAKAAGRYREALRWFRGSSLALLAPQPPRPLVIEALGVFLWAGNAAEALDLIDALPDAERRVGRIRMLELRAALALGDLDRAGPLFDGLIVDDLREGEESLADLWSEYHRALGTTPVPPIPAEIDYAMGD